MANTIRCVAEEHRPGCDVGRRSLHGLSGDAYYRPKSTRFSDNRDQQATFDVIGVFVHTDPGGLAVNLGGPE
jgi:hypothetical protein